VKEGVFCLEKVHDDVSPSLFPRPHPTTVVNLFSQS